MKGAIVKFPYKSFSEKDLRRMESHYYFLVLGGDFVCEDGTYSFTEKEISKMYNNALDNLVSMAEDGTGKDHKYAVELIGSLRIMPFRLH